VLLFTLGNSTDAFLLLRASQLGVPVALAPIPVPTATALRGAGAASVVAAATASVTRPAAAAPTTLDEVLEEIDRADAAAEFALPEPTPSTWFDEYDSSPSPLHPPQPKERQNPR